MKSLQKCVLLPVLAAIGIAFVAVKLFRSEEVAIKENDWFGAGKRHDDDTRIMPFEVTVPEETIKDLHDRLKKSRISHEPLEDVNDFSYGFNAKYLSQVKDYWLTKFDWRKQEKLLNQFKQLTTEIEGLKVHFYHAKPSAGKYKRVVPLLLVHGWPGNVFEFYKLIPLLVDPAAHGLPADFAFEVIAPSIPGYGFSAQPKKRGFSQAAAARIFRKLMLRVGHDKFYLQGGDWGSVIVSNLAKLYPENVHGVHLNMLMSVGMSGGNFKALSYSVLGTFFPKLFFADENHHGFDFFSNIRLFLVEMGYMHVQATKPDTVGTALNDSPIGLAAYILEKFSTWTNPDFIDLPDGGLTKKFTMDELLTIVMIYWTQGNIVSSQRFYREFFIDPDNHKLENTYLSVPTGHAAFKHELSDEPPEISSIMYNLTSRASFADGGHFAAFEHPEWLSRHLFSFVGGLLDKKF